MNDMNEREEIVEENCYGCPRFSSHNAQDGMPVVSTPMGLMNGYCNGDDPCSRPDYTEMITQSR
jgi:hypothetical protein